MKRKIILISIALSCLIAVNGQKNVPNLIDQADMKGHMYFLASDLLGGRETGKPGNEIAAKYIQTSLMKLGLNPGKWEEPFLQKIPFSSYAIDSKGSWLKANTGDGREICSSDSVLSLFPLASDLELTGELVFAGFAYENQPEGYSDLRGLELKNRIVMIMTRNPEVLRKLGSRDEYLFDEKLEQGKLMKVLTAGPKALIIVYDNMNRFDSPWESGLAGMLGSSGVSLDDKPAAMMPFRILFISRSLADRILAPSGYTVEKASSMIVKDGKPAGGEITGINISVKLAVERKKFTGYNVVGVIEGSDPVLRNECILYSAHFDHAGVNHNGEVNNGADDDASGCVALLELAEAFSLTGKKPLRSVVFAWVNAEEKGLLGSRYYADNPVIPMEKTILNINIDMIGRSRSPADTGKFMGFSLNITEPGEVQVYSWPENPELIKLLRSSASKEGVRLEEKGRNLDFGGSDHQSFESKGVPFLLFHSGIHRDLHTPADDPDKIDYDKMERVTRMLYDLGYKVADRRESFRK